MLPQSYTGATFDSRCVKPGMLFVALKGETQDGHAYIPKALEAGAVGIIDGYDELNRAACEKRKRLNAKVIGVTGSAGKTTTKELLRVFLSPLGKVWATEGNFNNHIGLPISILNCPDDADFLVLEMGTNHPGEIERLCQIAQPDIGVITNIGTAHIEFFGSRENIAKEKGVLFSYAHELCVAGADCAQLDILRRSVKCGCFQEVRPDSDRLELALSPLLPGRHNLSNALLAYAVAEFLGLQHDQALAVLPNLRLPGARWRRLDVGGVHFIDDTYNANPESMKAALRTLAELPAEGRKLAVLGDMFELGDNSPHYHAEVLDFAKSLGLDDIILVGSRFVSSRNLRHYSTVEELSLVKDQIFKVGDTILLKASHCVQLGKILV